jgi:uncharacterized protein YbjT (DUF2867 family)
MGAGFSTMAPLPRADFTGDMAENGLESGRRWSSGARVAWFFQNFSEHFLLAQVLSGVIAMPADDVAEPFADVEDIAGVAVAALTGDRHIGEIYELTGPCLLTFAAS